MHGTLPDLAHFFPDLEELELVQTCNLTPGRMWPWLNKFTKLKALTVFKTNRGGHYLTDFDMRKSKDTLTKMKLAGGSCASADGFWASPLPHWLNDMAWNHLELRAMNFNGALNDLDLSRSFSTMTYFGISWNRAMVRCFRPCCSNPLCDPSQSVITLLSSICPTAALSC